MEYYIIYLMFIHWIGDFVLQTEKMASRKRLLGVELFQHVGVYATTLLLGILISNGIHWSNFELPLILAFVIGNLGLHFATDAITSQFNNMYFGRNWHNFFVSVGFDQLIHFITLFLTMKFLLF